MHLIAGGGLVANASAVVAKNGSNAGFKVAADIPESARYRKWQSRRSREAGVCRLRGSKLAFRGCTG
jgi:hypothetical protein